ncbi:MAG: dUTP diphosphatase [Patescibacteria group bacterium]
MVRVKIKKLSPDAKLLTYAHEGDAGLDIYSVEDAEILPNERKAIKTGISSELPSGYAFFVWDKSGLAAEFGIKTMAGVIDSGYRGEIRIVLLNTSQKPYKIRKGEKIAQVILLKVEAAEIKESKELNNTERGEGGFGSTGK